jgi:hypothetical protein
MSNESAARYIETLDRAAARGRVLHQVEYHDVICPRPVRGDLTRNGAVTSLEAPVNERSRVS